MPEAGASSYAATVEAIETAYEFMLAYAAQGRDGDKGPAPPPIRMHLERLRGGLAEIAETARGEAKAAGADGGALAGFVKVLEADVAAARAKLELVLSAPSIGSQLVDNLNASIHLRALLTDLFVLDEFIKSLRKKT